MSTQLYNGRQTSLVHATTNYQQFTFDPANRPIDPGNLEKLYDAVSAKNLLAEFPILVTPEGVVLDGQHRVKVAEALDTPIYYIVATNMTVDDVQKANGAVSHWKLTDWLYSWSKRGKPDYIQLGNFAKAHPWMPLSAAISLCTYGDRAGSAPLFKSGGYLCNDIEWAGMVASAVLDFKPYVSFYRFPVFIGAVGMLFEHEGYDHDRMMAKMGYMSRKLVRCPDVATYMALFTEIYNYRTTADNRMTFEKLPSNSKKRREDRRNRNVKASAKEAAN